MRFSPHYRFGTLTALALLLASGCGGNSDSSTPQNQRDERAGTKLNRDGNPIFNGEGEQKEQAATTTRRRSGNSSATTDPTAQVNDGGQDGVVEGVLTDTDALTEDASTPADEAATTEPVQDETADAAAAAAEEARQIAEEKAEAERIAAAQAEAKKREAEQAAAAKAKREAEARKKREALARKEKARKKESEKKKKSAKARKAEEAAKAAKAAAAKLAQEQADAAKLAAAQKAEAVRLAKEMKDAQAAADAIRRATLEAAARKEAALQKEEIARIGKGLNTQCPYDDLEVTAEEGKLSVDQINCLDSSLDMAKTGMDKANISMVMITNAHAKGDLEEWERLMENHLTNVERENPALAYRYALYLFEKGPSESQSTYRWTGVALSGRSAWAGETYTERVNSIYKLRAAAAQSLWKQSIEALESFPGAENEGRVKTQRYLTRNVAKEWYDFASTHEQDPTMAYQLCSIATLEDEFCDKTEYETASATR